MEIRYETTPGKNRGVGGMMQRIKNNTDCRRFGGYCIWPLSARLLIDDDYFGSGQEDVGQGRPVGEVRSALSEHFREIMLVNGRRTVIEDGSLGRGDKSGPIVYRKYVRRG